MLKECQQNPEWAVGKAAPQKTKIFRIVRRHFMSFYMRLPILCAAVTACLLIGVPAALQAQTTRMDFDSQYKALSLRLSSRQLDSQTLDLAHQLIATAEKQSGAESWDASTGYYMLGFYYRAREDYIRAEAAFARAVAIQEKLPSGKNSGLAFYLTNLASAYEGLGAWGRAAEQYERSIVVRQQAEGIDSGALIIPLRSLAYARRRDGQILQAEAPLFRALDIAMVRNYQAEIDAITRSLNTLAVDYLNQGSPDDAVSLLERLLERLQNNKIVSPESIVSLNQLLERSRKNLFGSAYKSAKAASESKTKPVGASSNWPVDMEPGNLYFLVEVPHPKYNRRSMPLMVSAVSAEEAVSRVERAHAKALEKTFSRGEARPYKLIENGECPGPAWGAVVSNALDRPYPASDEYVWGSACAATPALAIRAAFMECQQRNPAGCDHPPEAGQDGAGRWSGPVISLALSGSTSWSGNICTAGCLPSDDDGFASFNAFTGNVALSGNRIQGRDDAIAKLGKQCGNRPCFYTITTLGCYFNTSSDDIAGKCTDTRLSPNGYSGSIRMQRPASIQ